MRGEARREGNGRREVERERGCDTKEERKGAREGRGWKSRESNIRERGT